MREILKQRLLKHLEFLDEEIKFYPKFLQMTRSQYFEDRDLRRNVERWIENIVNSSIDISKILLSIENINLPDTYKEIVLFVSNIRELNFDKAEQISRWVRLRNILTHEYLDLRWASIQKFISETGSLYKEFVERTNEYLERKILEAEEKP